MLFFVSFCINNMVFSIHNNLLGFKIKTNGIYKKI